MIGEFRVLGLVPARGGSKGVIRKNLRPVNNIPLVAWTIDSAKSSKYIDRLIVSTDDSEIAEVSEKAGAEIPFLRPARFAKDDSTTADVVGHAFETLDEKYDIIVVLQPTSPLRKSSDIDECIRLCMESSHSSVSVTKSAKTPNWMYTLNNGRLSPILPNNEHVSRRQDAPCVYELNGAVYAIKSSEFLKSKQFVSDRTLAYVMPKERSLDIDTELDFVLLDVLINK